MTSKETPRRDDEEQQAPEPVATAHKAGPAFAEPEQAISDLSKEIVRTLARSAGEQVTCRRIIGNHYRCNWWGPEKESDRGNGGIMGMVVTTHRVVKSQFLEVTKTAGGLAIKQAACGSPAK